MKAYLTSSENIAFNSIEKIMRLRQKRSALFLMSVNTQKLSKAFDKHFLALENVTPFSPSTSNPLYELSSYPNDAFYYINLYKHKNIKELIKALQFGRDFITQYNLKVILLFDAVHYEQLQEEAYDFFSVNSYSYAFVDHAYDFCASTIKKSEKLMEYMQEYEAYVNEKIVLPKIEVELLFQKSAILGNIGLIYSAKGDLEEALKYHKEALEIFTEIGYNHGIDIVQSNIDAILDNQE